RGHTRFKCDWSSDVCSSDLYGLPCCKVKYRGVDCGVKVDREIFCDSPIAKGMMCGRTRKPRFVCEWPSALLCSLHKYRLQQSKLFALFSSNRRIKQRYDQVFPNCTEIFVL